MALTPDQLAHYNDSKQPSLVAGFVILLLVNNSAVLARTILQFKHLSIKLEDYLLILATACADGIIVGYLLSVHNGLGLHIYRVIADDPNLPGQLIVIFKAAWASAILTCACLLCVKLSLLFFYRRLFIVGQTWLNVAWWANVVYAVLWSIGSIFFYLFQCHPIDYYWNRWYVATQVKPPFPVSGSCPNQVQQVSGPLITSLISDIAILALPLAALARLQISKRRRIGLIIIFSFGTFACICALVRIIVVFNTDVNRDPTWGIANFLAWTSAEQCIAILCACIPIIASHIGLVIKQLRTRPTRSKSYSGSRGIRLNDQNSPSQGQGDSEVNLRNRDLTTIESAGTYDGRPEMPTGQIRVETDLHWNSDRLRNGDGSN